MKLYNIDSKDPYKIERLNIPMFILSVIHPLEEKFFQGWNFIEEMDLAPHPVINRVVLSKAPTIFPMHMFLQCRYENIAWLLHTIPIYLREAISGKTEARDAAIIDQLGAYYPSRGKNEGPYIEIFMHEINEATKNTPNADMHFKWLFTKVLIHELAHAALDMHNNLIILNSDKKSVEKVPYSTEFGRWREESMANAATLYIIKETRDKPFYTYVKKFMLSQPPEYALGVKMESLVPNDFHFVESGKYNGVHIRLQQEWLKYVKGAPAIGELHEWNTRLSYKWIYLYDNKYYINEKEFVMQIVKDVLDRYVAKNHSIMSSDEFQNIFPRFNVLGSGIWTYEASHLVRGNPSYSNESIVLRDGEFTLCNSWFHYWNNSQVMDFTKNAGCDFEVYINHQI